MKIWQLSCVKLDFSNRKQKTMTRFVNYTNGKASELNCLCIFNRIYFVGGDNDEYRRGIFFSFKFLSVCCLTTSLVKAIHALQKGNVESMSFYGEICTVEYRLVKEAAP